MPRGGGADAAAVEPLANVVYGRNAVREALRGRRLVRRVWATESTAKEGFAGARVDVVAADEITARCGTDSHQGVCAEVDPYVYADAAELLAVPDPFIVALDEVTDPQNLGAVIRTAECAGVTGVVIPERRAAEVTGAVAKASAGAVEHLPVAQVRNLADFLAEAKRAGCWTYGAAAGARTPYGAPDYSGGVVLVLGAEGRGLRPRWRAPATTWSRSRCSGASIRSTSAPPGRSSCTRSCRKGLTRPQNRAMLALHEVELEG